MISHWWSLRCPLRKPWRTWWVFLWRLFTCANNRSHFSLSWGERLGFRPSLEFGPRSAPRRVLWEERELLSKTAAGSQRAYWGEDWDPCLPHINRAPTYISAKISKNKINDISLFQYSPVQGPTTPTYPRSGCSFSQTRNQRNQATSADKTMWARDTRQYVYKKNIQDGGEELSRTSSVSHISCIFNNRDRPYFSP